MTLTLTFQTLNKVLMSLAANQRFDKFSLTALYLDKHKICMRITILYNALEANDSCIIRPQLISRKM